MCNSKFVRLAILEHFQMRVSLLYSRTSTEWYYSFQFQDIERDVNNFISWKITSKYGRNSTYVQKFRSLVLCMYIRVRRLARSVSFFHFSPNKYVWLLNLTLIIIIVIVVITPTIRALLLFAYNYSRGFAIRPRSLSISLYPDACSRRTA